MALLPLRPHAQNDRQLSMGTSPAGSVLRSSDEDLRAGALARPAFAVRSCPTSCTRKRRQEGREEAEDKKPKEAKARRPGDKKPDAKKKRDKKRQDGKKDEKTPPEVKIDFDDMASRLSEVPVPPGNYDALQATEKRLCWLTETDDTPKHLPSSASTSPTRATTLDTVLADVKSFEISPTGRRCWSAKATTSSSSTPM